MTKADNSIRDATTMARLMGDAPGPQDEHSRTMTNILSFALFVINNCSRKWVLGRLCLRE